MITSDYIHILLLRLQICRKMSGIGFVPKYSELPTGGASVLTVHGMLVWVLSISFLIIPRTAIRFGRMPQSEKLRLKAEILTGEREVEDPQLADQKTLAKQIYEAYMKNFNMNKCKARTILTGKTSTPVRESCYA